MTAEIINLRRARKARARGEQEVAADMARLEDLLFARARWKFASTMPDNPHSYTLRRQWAREWDDGDQDFQWTVATIRIIGDREKFRDFVVEFEGTLTKGHIELCLRTPTRIDRAVEAYSLDAQRLTPGVPFRMTINFIGSRVTYTPENGQPQEKTVPFSQSRKGAIAFVVDEGAELKVTKLKIRVLR